MQPQAHSMQHPGSKISIGTGRSAREKKKSTGMSDTTAWVIPVPQRTTPQENLLLGIHIPELRQWLRWGCSSKCSLWSKIQAEP